MIAETVVHTSGINWESVGAIAACVAVIVAIMTWYIGRRDRKQREIVLARDAESTRQNQEIKQEIASSIENLSTILQAKLETKETVARISERLARLEGAAGKGVMNND